MRPARHGSGSPDQALIRRPFDAARMVLPTLDESRTLAAVLSNYLGHDLTIPNEERMAPATDEFRRRA
jgi:hypothetical protein